MRFKAIVWQIKFKYLISMLLLSLAVVSVYDWQVLGLVNKQLRLCLGLWPVK